VKDVEQRTENGILFVFSLFCENMNLELRTYACHMQDKPGELRYSFSYGLRQRNTRIPIQHVGGGGLCARPGKGQPYARRMGQPTQRATNYTARSNIVTAQIFLHANGQRPKRASNRQRSRRRQARGATHRARPRSPSKFVYRRHAVQCE